jgi:hypothetical protein
MTDRFRKLRQPPNFRFTDFPNKICQYWKPARDLRIQYPSDKSAGNTLSAPRAGILAARNPGTLDTRVI